MFPLVRLVLAEQFYEAHIGDWPELAIVAEHVKRHVRTTPPKTPALW